MKRSKNLMLSLAVLAGALVGCGNTNGSGTTGGVSEKRIKIGVVMYSFSDVQGKTIENYCNYLSKNLPLDFAFEATNYQDDQQITAVENLISAGCKGIISGYDTSLVSCLDTAKNAGVYYSLALDYSSATDFKDSPVNEYFVGGTQQFGGDLVALGKTYAKAAVDAGLKDIGGVSFPAWAFVEGPALYNAFKAEVTALDSTAKAEDLVLSAGFMADDVQTATNKVLTDTPTVDSIFGLSSGLDYVYPVIRDKNIKLLSMGYDDSVKSLFEAGKLVASGNNNHVQSIASCVARLVNAIDGRTYSDATSGKYNQDNIVNGVAGYPVMTSVADVADYTTYIAPTDMSNGGAVTADELKNVMLRYNDKATLSDLNTLTNRTMAEIKTVRTSK